jgi:hypothetical protein
LTAEIAEKSRGGRREEPGKRREEMQRRDAEDVAAANDAEKTAITFRRD